MSGVVDFVGVRPRVDYISMADGRAPDTTPKRFCEHSKLAAVLLLVSWSSDRTLLSVHEYSTFVLWIQVKLGAPRYI